MTRSSLILIGILGLSFNIKASNFFPEEKNSPNKISFHRSINCSSEEKNEISLKYIKGILNKYCKRYEHLNKTAPLWVKKIDEKLNLITDFVKNPSPPKLLDANIPDLFKIIINDLNNIDLSLPNKSEDIFYKLSFSDVSDNSDVPDNNVIQFNIMKYYFYVLNRYKRTAKKLHNNIMLMNQELHRFFNECLIAYETENFEELNFLKNDILLELNAAYQDPIFTMLDN